MTTDVDGVTNDAIQNSSLHEWLLDFKESTTFTDTSYFDADGDHHSSETAKTHDHPGVSSILLNAELVVILIILLAGIPGNLLTCVVMMRRAMGRSSATVFFTAIAIADTLVLLSGAPDKISKYFFSLRIRDISQWTCRANLFLTRGSADTAVWLFLAATVDRFFAVRFPLKVKLLFTPTRAKIACLVIGMVAALKNFPVFFTFGEERVLNEDGTERVLTCGHAAPHFSFYNRHVSPWLSLTVYAFIPVFSISVLNILIIYTLQAFSSSREKMTNQASAEEHNKMRPLAVMLLGISFAFLVLLIPNICCIIAIPYVPRTPRAQTLFFSLFSVADCLVFTNHAINFYICLATGSKFRLEFRKLCGLAESETPNWSSNSSASVTNHAGQHRKIRQHAKDEETQISIVPMQTYSQHDEKM